MVNHPNYFLTTDAAQVVAQMATGNSGIFTVPISQHVWNTKYRHSTDKSVDDTFKRVAFGVCKNNALLETHALNAMRAGLFMPAGRILAGAGTDKRVTLINCFVSPEIQDSMHTDESRANSLGIMDSLKVAAFTQQMGGGIGMNFDLRPMGALVQSLDSVASGNLYFMDMWNAMCSTVMSSGSRRGAMMATMRVDHPDILDFIRAKRVAGRLTNFNVSVLVTDEFLAAVKKDKQWVLHYPVPPANGERKLHPHPSGKHSYVYRELRARDLWDEIIRSTYEYAEPGVLFIDQINARNNLYYCETIKATNPCGEQPLPPNSDCNLGAINLAVLPSTKGQFDADVLTYAAQLGVTFLDRVLYVSLFPTPEQKAEALAKRRVGLGISGLANLFQRMGVRYGSPASVEIAEDVMRTIAVAAYKQSVALAKAYGPCSVVNSVADREMFLQADLPSRLAQLPEAGTLRDDIATYGIRNAVLLTIAPTGTTSLFFGNVASGCEPVFALDYKRKIRNADETFSEHVVEDYGVRLYRDEAALEGLGDNASLPQYFNTTADLTVQEHINIQAALQKWVDASISKTINCPADMSFEDFKEVYSLAFAQGCKGCTTYRPSDVRGSILSTIDSASASSPPVQQPVLVDELVKRPVALCGKTYKVKWPAIDYAFYVTINDIEDEVRPGTYRPFEIFIVTKSVVHQEWIAALTRMISAIFRRGGDVSFVIDELKQVHSAQAGYFINEKYVPSIVGLIASVIETHFRNTGYLHDEGPQTAPHAEAAPERRVSGEGLSGASICGACQAPAVLRREGCSTCMNCGLSNCG